MPSYTPCFLPFFGTKPENARHGVISGQPRPRLHTLAAVIILTVRRPTGSNGNTPSLATPTLSGKSAETALASCQNPAAGQTYRHPKHK